MLNMLCTTTLQHKPYFIHLEKNQHQVLAGTNCPQRRNLRLVLICQDLPSTNQALTRQQMGIATKIQYANRSRHAYLVFTWRVSVTQPVIGHKYGTK